VYIIYNNLAPYNLVLVERRGGVSSLKNEWGVEVG
jgi:hypothetical protein